MMGRWLNLALELTEAQDNSDNSDKSPPKVHVVEPIVPIVPFVTPDLIEDRAEANIIAWINNHPPDLPLSQNHCAACGEYIEVYDTHWVHLGDGALIHYSGKYGKDCWERWQEIRRNNAKIAFKTSKGD
jgi:hypothetical protein